MNRDNSTLDLFGVPAYRLHRKGQATSKAALEKTERPRANRQKRVYDAIVKYGAKGAIPEEVAVFMNEELIDVRRCFSVLKLVGKIEPTGEQRENGKGNACIVWRASL